MRLEVAGLYRGNVLARLLEEHLADVAGVKDARASVLTGRLLVVYQPSHVDPDTLATRILSLVARHAGDCRLPACTPRRPAGAVAARAAGGLGHLGGLFKGLLSPGHPVPSFAAAAASLPRDDAGPAAQEAHPWHAIDPGRVIAQLESSEKLGLGVRGRA